MFILRVFKLFILSVILTGTIENTALAETYVCEPKTSLRIDDSGKYEKSYNEEDWLSVRLEFNTETSELIINRRNGKPYSDGIYQTIAKSSRGNSLVVAQIYEGAGSSGIDLLRIHSWNDPITFEHNKSLATIAGICEIRSP